MTKTEYVYVDKFDEYYHVTPPNGLTIKEALATGEYEWCSSPDRGVFLDRRPSFVRERYLGFNERRLGIMNSFIARSPRQLDLCLKLLYDAGVSFIVNVRENDKRKIEYVIKVQADEETYEKLMETYRILIS